MGKEKQIFTESLLPGRHFTHPNSLCAYDHLWWVDYYYTHLADEETEPQEDELGSKSVIS